jgi:hypothetical protein
VTRKRVRVWARREQERSVELKEREQKKMENKNFVRKINLDNISNSWAFRENLPNFSSKKAV